MARKLREPIAPGPMLAGALRLPIALYAVGLGRLFGHRFLLLHHTGAKTGLARRTPLEVVEHDAATGTYYVAAGFGARSHWFRNLQVHPRARIDVAGRSLEVRARIQSPAQSAALMLRYAQKHPIPARILAKLMGFEVDGSASDYEQLPSLGLHFVALEPLATPATERFADSRRP